ncbi:MAG: UDP-N-acetylglucosamine 2-epimerase (hydrolyzing) [Rhodocyclaceae bacterium]|nr:MAG: UDP-N-acetylglucosamine 2-epimerase (hydrolyzing) [Rhodocyclaceae bacterium]
MSAQRKICVVTGSRAEYGLLHWVMKAIVAHPALQLQVIATGMHLSPEFGLTYHQIEADGFVIDAKVEMLLSGDTATAVAKSVGLGVIGFADAYARLTPDVVVVLGDRFEILAAAQSAALARIPIAHIHGGETSEGAVDEGIRHAVTKLSTWHFVAAEAYRKRVVQLGEHPDRVFNVGAPGLDSLACLPLLSLAELEVELSMKLGSPLLLVTYHPATLGDVPPGEAVERLLAALDRFPAASVVFTYPNADAGGREIVARLKAYEARHAGRVKGFTSLGQLRYLSLLVQADVVVGNSSSALIEAPAARTATVDVGPRQRGRLKAASVLEAAENADEIAARIAEGLSPDFQASLATVESLYGHGGASQRIVEELVRLRPVAAKAFFDIEHGY